MSASTTANVPGAQDLNLQVLLQLQQTRLNFELLAIGFSYALVLRFGTTLTTRRLRGTDTLAAINLGLWIIYLTVMAVDVWYRTVYGTVLANWGWVTDVSTFFYSFVLCSIFYMSFMRLLALMSPHFGESWRKRLEWIGLALMAIIFILRGARSILAFIGTSQNNFNINLSQNSSNLQLATILPTLLLKVIFDVMSMGKLYVSRVKYIAAAGKEAFRAITNALAVEIVILIIATIVAFQETLKYPSWKFSFIDWILFSWCLASWIEQRRQFRAIFGAALASTSGGGANSESEVPRKSISASQVTASTANYSGSGSKDAAYTPYQPPVSNSGSGNGYVTAAYNNASYSNASTANYSGYTNSGSTTGGSYYPPTVNANGGLASNKVHTFSSRYPNNTTPQNGY